MDKHVTKLSIDKYTEALRLRELYLSAADDSPEQDHAIRELEKLLPLEGEVQDFIQSN